MPPTSFDIFQGDAKTMFMKIVQDPSEGGDPIDLTNCTEIVVSLPNSSGTITQLKLSLSQVSITLPAVLGKFSVPVSAVVSALLNIGEFQNVDVTFTISGQVFTVRFAGALSVFEVA